MAAVGRRATEPYRAFVELGSRLSRDTLLYAVGTSLVLPVGLVATAFLTRHFHVAQFGELAALFAFASVLTIILNMVFLQGPLLLVFLHADEGVEISPEEAEIAAKGERPTMLSTGLFVTFLIGVVGVICVRLNSGQLAQWLTGRRSAADAVTLAGISAAAGAIWRYVTNVTRFEKRAASFATWAAARPVVALLVTVPLVLSGAGLSSALIGTTAGSLVSAAGALWISRRSYAFAIDPGHARRAFHAGLPWIAVVLGLYFAHSADVLLLRATASNRQLGLYRLADSLSQIISYAVSAYHLAQVPLDATLMSQAAYDVHSRNRVMAAYVLVYMIGALFLTLLLTAVGGLVISVIAPGYDGAVQYIPLTALAYVAYGFLLTVFRAGDFFQQRTRAYGWTAGSAGLLVIIFALLGGRFIGVAGVPIGATLGCLLPSLALLLLGAYKRHPLPIDYPRLLAALGLAAVCWAPGAIAAHQDSTFTVAIRILSLACFPVGCLALGIIPRRLLGDIRSILARLRPRRRETSALVSRVDDLPAAQRNGLLAIVRDRLTPAAAAARLGIDEATLLRTLTAALRRLGGGTGEFPLDEGLGHYLASGERPADRDSRLRELRSSGASMVEFRVMERLYHQLHSAPRRVWNHALLANHTRSLRARSSTNAPVVLRALADFDWSVEKAANEAHISPHELRQRVVAELRSLAGGGVQRPTDQLVARYLLGDEERPPTNQLWTAGVDPIDLHRLELTLTVVVNRARTSVRSTRTLRGLPKKLWLAGRAVPS